MPDRKLIMKKLRTTMGLILVMSLLVTCLLALGSCTKPGTGLTGESEAMEALPARLMIEDMEVFYSEERAQDSSSVEEERMIVRTGNMSLVVDNVVEAVDEIGQLVVGFGGYVVSSSISGEEQEMRGRISLRVTDERFEDTMAELRDLAIRVESESTDSRDVTEEYTDLEARLRNAEATENQYLALLETARDVEDILKIYDSLSRVRHEIEQIKGRMQYLERTSSMSFVTVYLEPAVTAKPLVPVDWNIAEVFKSVIRGIVTFGQWLVTALIWLLAFSPIWGSILSLVLWRRRHRREAQ
ncbi:DUF4349 domain-containing protein [Chloroflexota bacterium]